jgi:hypothetical protein
MLPSIPNVPPSGRLSNLLDDPLTKAMGAPIGDITEAWEAKHMRSRQRCQEHGVEKDASSSV